MVAVAIICTSLQTDNHASTDHSIFYRPDALHDAQPTVSKHWRQDADAANTIFALKKCAQSNLGLILRSWQSATFLFKEQIKLVTCQLSIASSTELPPPPLLLWFSFNQPSFLQLLQTRPGLSVCVGGRGYLQAECPFTMNVFRPFSGTTRVSRCQKRTSGLYGARED